MIVKCLVCSQIWKWVFGYGGQYFLVLLGLDKMIYFTAQRQSVVVIFYSNCSCANITVQLFNHRKSKKYFNQKCVLELVAKFWEMNLCKNNAMDVIVLGLDFTLNTRQLTTTSGIWRISVLKNNKTPSISPLRSYDINLF